MAWNLIKMTSDGKSYNCKVLHLVETDDFDIKIVPIRGRMQKLEPAQRDPPVKKIWRPEPDTYVGMFDGLRE